MRRKYATALMMVACLVGGSSLTATANNIQVTNVSLSELDTVNSNITINLDVSWDNSWRDGLNWDAAWIFAKWRMAGTTNWGHCTLLTNGHTVPAGSTIAQSDAVGVFIYRSAQGTGDVYYTALGLRWDYGDGGLASASEVEISVHAIEMVYVPQGAFETGDGSDQGGLYVHDTLDVPWTVDSEDAIVMEETLGNHWALWGYINAGTLPAAFPKGYNAFYCMKYELSQKQYADFLNLLTETQKNNRYYVGSANRYTITGTWPNLAAGAPDRACNFMSWDHTCAYLDWAGLRPMTELEFAKACRGPVAALDGEHAYGSAGLGSVNFIINNDGQPDATVSNPSANGNVHWSGTDGNAAGPLRCGIFAASYTNPPPTRVEAGASYWGIMELSGNVYEPCVGIRDDCWGYTGVHGDGTLTAAGDDNVPNWPSAVTRCGGAWNSAQERLHVANRNQWQTTPNEASDNGCRGVRTAP